MRRVFSVLFVIIMAFSLLIPVSAEGAVAVVVDADGNGTLEVDAGEAFDLYVNITDSDPARALNINSFTYESEYISVDSMEWLLTGSVMSDIGTDPVIAFSSAVDVNKAVMVLHCTAKNVVENTTVSCSVYAQYPTDTPVLETVEIEVTAANIKVLGQDFDPLTLAGAGKYTYGDEINVAVDGAPADATIDYTVKYKTDEDAVAVDSDIDSIKDVGIYTISATVSKAGYNTVKLDPITVTIQKKGVTAVIEKLLTKEYDGNDDITVAETDVKAFGVNGEEVTFQVTDTDVKLDSADAGDYTGTVILKWSNNTGKTSNYELPAEVTFAAKITPKPITVTAVSKTKVVNAPEPAFTYTTTDGALVGSDVLTGNLTRNAGEEAGEYAILQGTLTNENNPNYDITFVPGILKIIDKEYTSLVIDKNPEKMEYIEDQTFDPTGIVLKAYYDDGDGNPDNDPYDEITKGFEFAPEIFEIVGNNVVTIKYGNKEVELTGIQVTAKVLQGITVDSSNAKTEYIVGQTFSADGLLVTPVYNNGVEYDALDSDAYTVSEPDMSIVGEQTITVTYETATAEYTINVKDKTLKELVVTEKDSAAVKNVYVEGKSFDSSNLVVTAKYDNGDEVTVTDFVVKPDGALATTDKYVTISWTDTERDQTASYQYEITVNEAEVTGFTFVDWKKDYIEDQEFDVASVVLNVQYNNDTSKEVTSGFTVYPMEMTMGLEQVTVTYAGISMNAGVTVSAKVLEEIAVPTSAAKQYIEGESYKTSAIDYIEATYNNGKTYMLSPAKYTVEPEIMAVDTTELVFTYTEGDVTKTATLAVTVLECVATNGDDRYASIVDALNDAEDEDTIDVIGEAVIDEDVIINEDITVDVDEDASLTQEEDTDITVSEGSLTIVNNTEEDITLTINGEEVTIAAGESYTAEPVVEEDDGFDAYYSFYMQMLHWRNRIFNINYKQTEGGTVSGLKNARIGQTVTVTITPDEGYAIADVLVNGKSVGAVESYKIRNIKSNQTVSAVFEKIAATSPFVDVSVDAPYFDAVLYVYNNGIINGVSETEMVFAPDTTMTRAMFVTVLGRMSGVNMADYPVVTFADCEAGSWYAPYVEWAAQAGIVKGYSAEAFGPMDEITVEQAAVILYRYIAYMGYNTAADADLANYADGAQVSEWAAEQMKWALANNIYVSDTTLDPQAPAARSLVTEMLYNLSVWMG